jgi:hypothetical protein
MLNEVMIDKRGDCPHDLTATPFCEQGHLTMLGEEPSLYTTKEDQRKPGISVGLGLFTPEWEKEPTSCGDEGSETIAARVMPPRGMWSPLNSDDRGYRRV